ncbi:DUF2793 domain-containing protein [Rhizobiales bacterium 3FA27D7]|jgi:microcompartment protein CcmK/EutM|uniref:DUF2793 domain-containing protein n=1 Tax=Mesorhizobium sp. 2RAF21 TaxID=3232995 RepID=UPI0010F5B7DF
MSEQTKLLELPYILPSQAQKHVIHNEALRRLDAVVQLAVLDRDLAAPPASPQEGDRYLVAVSPTGAWAGKAGMIAAWQDGAWAFLVPRRGWLAWVADETRLLAFDGGVWAAVDEATSLQRLGVNATADVTNRLVVRSEAVLFDNVGAGHQVKVNKAGAGHSATVLFQTGYSGRAEFGLAGDDDWRVKTSADGASWNEALVADKGTGAVRFPAGVEHAATRKPLSGMILTPGGDGQVSILRLSRTRSQDPRQATLSAVAGSVLTLAANDADLFFDTTMRDVSYVRVWNVSKAAAQPAWIKWNPAANQLQVTSAADVAGWVAGEVVQLGDIAGRPGVPAGFTRGYALDISPMLQNQLGAVFRQAAITFRCDVQGIGTRVGVLLSRDTGAGSFFGGNSLSDGAVNTTMHIVPTTQLSPVSNSNLVYVREDGNGANTLGATTISVCGVWV